MSQRSTLGPRKAAIMDLRRAHVYRLIGTKADIGETINMVADKDAGVDVATIRSRIQGSSIGCASSSD
jgi:hypothetical protein